MAVFSIFKERNLRVVGFFLLLFSSFVMVNDTTLHRVDDVYLMNDRENGIRYAPRGGLSTILLR